MGTFDNETVTIFINVFFALAFVTAVLVVAAFTIVVRGRGTAPKPAAAARVIALPETAPGQRAA